ncbi:MFS transporter OS=Streptomyces microflavus OX=1919 GN=Smic_54090 PE=4 SV=1 [Streptomyces microflavus]
MFCVGLFAGAHMLGFTVAGESVPGALVGSSAAIVNGICFIVGGLLQAVPGRILPDSPSLGDYGGALLMMPILLVLGALAGFFIKDTAKARVDA